MAERQNDPGGETISYSLEEGEIRIIDLSKA